MLSDERIEEIERSLEYTRCLDSDAIGLLNDIRDLLADRKILLNERKEWLSESILSADQVGTITCIISKMKALCEEALEYGSEDHKRRIKTKASCIDKESI